MHFGEARGIELHGNGSRFDLTWLTGLTRCYQGVTILPSVG